MDWSSEKYSWLSLLIGLALVSAWGVLSLAHAYDRALTKVSNSFIQVFMIVDQLGVIEETLTRISVDQQAFLSTGDQRFQDGVIESAQAFVLHRDRLSLVAGTKLQGSLSSLSRSMDQVLASVAESDEIKEVRGRSSAVAFFESEQVAIAQVQSQAEQLRIEISGSVSDAIRSGRTPGPVFEDFLYDAPVASGLVQKRPFLAVKRGWRRYVSVSR